MKITGFDSSRIPSDNGNDPVNRSKEDRPVIRDRIEISLNRDQIPETRNNRLDISGYSPSNASSTSEGFRERAINRIRPGLDVDRAIKLSLVRRRIADGYYNRPENMEKLADILIDKLNLEKTGN